MSDERNEAEDANPAIEPGYYRRGGIEVIDFIEAYDLNYYLATAVKYIARAGRKDPAKTVEDLEKAGWYIRRNVERIKREQAGDQG